MSAAFGRAKGRIYADSTEHAIIEPSKRHYQTGFAHAAIHNPHLHATACSLRDIRHYLVPPRGTHLTGVVESLIYPLHTRGLG